MVILECDHDCYFYYRRKTRSVIICLLVSINRDVFFPKCSAVCVCEL